MLEVLQAPENYFAYKCAEIHFSNMDEPFSITCINCDLITSCFEEFCKHFLQIHTESIEKIPEVSKVEMAEETLEDDWNAFEKLPENSVETFETLEIKEEIQNQDDRFVEKLKNERINEECQFLEVNTKEALDDFNNECVEKLMPSEGSDDYMIEVLEFDVLPDECKEKDDEKKIAADELPNTENDVTVKYADTCEIEVRLSPEVTTKRRPTSKGFKCAYCDKTFSCKANCVTHQFRHTAVRNFNCAACSKSFYTHSELRNHMRYHNNERSYVCEHCGKAFRHSWVLKKHCRTHSPQNPTLPCPKCGKLFAYRDNLRNHLQTHNTAEMFSCELCGKKFTQGKLLWAHNKRYHVVKKNINKAKK